MKGYTKKEVRYITWHRILVWGEGERAADGWHDEAKTGLDEVYLNQELSRALNIIARHCPVMTEQELAVLNAKRDMEPCYDD